MNTNEEYVKKHLKFCENYDTKCKFISYKLKYMQI